MSSYSPDDIASMRGFVAQAKTHAKHSIALTKNQHVPIRFVSMEERHLTLAQMLSDALDEIERLSAER